MLVNAFNNRARDMGRGLGVPDNVATVFAEAEVRASVAFPLSNVLTLLARACEASYGGDGAQRARPSTPRVTRNALCLSHAASSRTHRRRLTRPAHNAAARFARC